VLFNGSSQYLTLPASSNWAMTGNFTVECWVNTNLPSNYSGTILSLGSNSSAYAGLRFQITRASSGATPVSIEVLIATNGGSWGLTGATSGLMVNGIWNHVAVVRSSGVVTAYINGVGYNIGTINGTLYAGPYNSIGKLDGYSPNPFYYNGYISNLRIVNGTALYTASFSVPTSPLTAIANTSLLTCNAATIIDASSNNFTITNNGTATVSSEVTPFTSTSYASTFKFKNVNNAASVLPGTQRAIFGYGYTTTFVSLTNLVSNTGVVATDTTGVGTARQLLAAAGYGTDKAIFGYGSTGTVTAITNLVSNTGVVASDTTGVGTSRYGASAAAYGTNKAIFGYGNNFSANLSMTNLVSNTGVVSTDTTGVGTARRENAAAAYGSDKSIFGYGYNGSFLSMTNLVSNTGVVATDTTGVGAARYGLGAAGYGTDKAIFGYGNTSSGLTAITNLVSNTGVVANDTAGVGTARQYPSAAGYGTDKAIFGYGYTSIALSMSNLVSSTGVVATDTTGVGTSRYALAAAGFSNSTPAPSGGSFKKVYEDFYNFTISPAYLGITNWDLNVNGPLSLNVSGSWTITPRSSFTGKVKMWGGGGGAYTQQVGVTVTGGSGGFSSGSVSFESGVSYRIVTSLNGNGAVGNGGGLAGVFSSSIAQQNSIMIAGGGGNGHAYNSNIYGNGGAGGGSSGQDGTARTSNQNGGGGSQTAGGFASAYNSVPAGSALQVNGGNGGAGYWGGGSENAGGAGGGSGYIHPTKVTNGITVTGNYTTVANSSDADILGAGQGSLGNTTGSIGKIILSL
jgi:hypothetical protein